LSAFKEGPYLILVCICAWWNDQEWYSRKWSKVRLEKVWLKSVALCLTGILSMLIVLKVARRPVRPLEQSQPTAFNNIFHWFFFEFVFCAAARLSGARCQVPGYGKGHAHKASPPSPHFTWHFKFTIYIKWRNANAKTTTVVKWNCSQFSRGSASNYAKELLCFSYGNRFGSGSESGSASRSKKIAAAVVHGILLKTNFVYVKYINYVFKWMLWFCFVFFYLSSVVKDKCLQHNTAIFPLRRVRANKGRLCSGGVTTI